MENLDILEAIENAFKEGAQAGYRKGRSDAAEALTQLARANECRYVRTDWTLFDNEMPQIPNRWVAANHAINAARGNL